MNFLYSDVSCGVLIKSFVFTKIHKVSYNSFQTYNDDNPILKTVQLKKHIQTNLYHSSSLDGHR